jgi:general secretion pathway protein G
MVMALIGIIATLSIPAFNNYVNRTKSRRAMSEIRTLGTELSAFALDKGTNPTSLGDINRSGYLDPWKRPYVFTNIAGGGAPLEGAFDPLNKDFDLYSLGADGLSAIADGDPTNEDDIVRFNDGSYVGMRLQQP